MSDKDHVDVLGKGVEEWNEWRRNNPNVEPDLSGIVLRFAFYGRSIYRAFDFSNTKFRKAELVHADLSHMNLRNADFSDANLVQAIFFGSILFGANFSRAKLSLANFQEADLINVKLEAAEANNSKLMFANLFQANLEKADLSGASLVGTNLSRARLQGANIADAIVHQTLFVNTNLSGVNGLDKCHHQGPSVLDYQTLAQSGPLPVGFLRGCGLSDELIKNLPFRNDLITFSSCFISYSVHDHGFVRRLYGDLQDEGVRCWFAPEDLKIGEKIRTGLDESIRVHDKLLLVLSKDSIASPWVEQEVETALSREQMEKRLILLPIRIDDAVMHINSGWPALIRNTRNIGDFQHWQHHHRYQASLRRLLRDLTIN